MLMLMLYTVALRYPVALHDAVGLRSTVPHDVLYCIGGMSWISCYHVLDLWYVVLVCMLLYVLRVVLYSIV